MKSFIDPLATLILMTNFLIWTKSLFSLRENCIRTFPVHSAAKKVPQNKRNKDHFKFCFERLMELRKVSYWNLLKMVQIPWLEAAKSVRSHHMILQREVLGKILQHCMFYHTLVCCKLKINLDLWKPINISDKNDCVIQKLYLL